MNTPDERSACAELALREPIFHRPEFGTTRADFARVMAPDFWEVGASGAKYSREFVLGTLDRRHAQRVHERLEVSDFVCSEIAPALFLVTYQLDQDGRLSRRSTLWRWTGDAWIIIYHQGTLIAAAQAGQRA